MWRRQSAGSNIINDPHWLNTIQYSIVIGYLNREFFSQKESDVFISVSSQTRFKKEKKWDTTATVTAVAAATVADMGVMVAAVEAMVVVVMEVSLIFIEPNET